MAQTNGSPGNPYRPLGASARNRPQVPAAGGALRLPSLLAAAKVRPLTSASQLLAGLDARLFLAGFSASGLGFGSIPSASRIAASRRFSASSLADPLPTILE